MSEPKPERRCNATVDGKLRCEWRGTQDELAEHALETGHPLCICCFRSLSTAERQTCQDCIGNARADLADIEYAFAMIDDVAEHAGYRSLALPGGDALVMAADGNNGGRYTPCDDPKFRDPMSVLAILESNERDWRLEFGHGPAVNVATVSGCLAYLVEWLWLAARTHPGFDDYKREIGALRRDLARVTTTVDYPKRLPAECFDCGGRLVRDYRAPLEPIEQRQRRADEVIEASVDLARWQRDAERTYGIPDDALTPLQPSLAARDVALRALVGSEDEGLTDAAICSKCGGEYDTESYGLALRMRVAALQGWVSVKLASETCRRAEPMIWRWLRSGQIDAAYSNRDRRIIVKWEHVKTLDADTKRRHRSKAVDELQPCA